MDPATIAAGLRLIGQVASTPTAPNVSGGGFVAPSIDASGFTVATGGSRATGSTRAGSPGELASAQLLGGYGPLIAIGFVGLIALAMLRRR